MISDEEIQADVDYFKNQWFKAIARGEPNSIISSLGRLNAMTEAVETYRKEKKFSE